MSDSISSPKFLVGLGASAGGLEALERFFDHLPQDSGGSFIVVMHLSRDFKSMLDELLSRHTKMSVQPAISQTRLQANTVYVIQPATTIQVNRTHIEVASRSELDVSGPATSIDTLFASIAKYWRNDGAAIVLSGSGSDGKTGVEAVFDAGGFTCAQAPETAKFDSMPVSAIATGKVKAVEAPDQLGETVLDGVILQSRTAEPPIPSDSDMALRQILDSVVGAADLDVAQYKHSTFERRVRRRMMDLDFDSLKAYAKHIAEDPEEAQILSSTLLIGVTEFFRDEEAFSLIRRQVIPEIIRIAHEEDRPIRMWVPGCATGEEAYSHALLFAEALQDMPFRIDVQIFASDISRDFLSKAGRGEYSTDAIKNVPKELQSRYFTKVTGHGNGSGEPADQWLISTEIRKMIVFAPHDLLSDPPFTRLDMISCRNLLIYFSLEAQQRILNSFAFGLRERGFLFLGPSETVGAQRPAFDFIDTRNRVFRRTDIKRSALAIGQTPDRNPYGSKAVGRARTNAKLREAALQPAYAALLRQFAPASLLISQEKELLHSFGDARRYLLPPEGVAHFDVADMVDPALKTSLLAGIERVFRDKKPISFSRISLETTPEQGRIVDLTVQPLIRESDGNVSHVLAIIDDSKYQAGEDTSAASSTLSIDLDQLTQERVEELEAELDRTREALQSTIEEIETTNEELQAANEELMSANEELQSTNEELSSVNEELYSVNAEYHRQNDELTRLSSDFDKLLHATEIGVVFLDPQSKITRFTSQAGRLFRLTDSDVSRPFSNYRSPFETLDPAELVERAQTAGHSLEERTVDSEGQAWLVRVVAEDFHVGTIMLFVNISQLRDAELAAEAATEKLEAIRTAAKAYYMELDNAGEQIMDHLGWQEFVGKEDADPPLDFKAEFVHPDDKANVQSMIEKRDEISQGMVHQRMWHAPSDSYRYVQTSFKKMANGRWQLIGLDVDDLVRQKNALEEQNAVLDATMQACSTILAYVGVDKTYRAANPAYVRLMDAGHQDIVGLKIAEVMPPELYAVAEPYIDRVLQGEVVETVIAAPLGDAPVQIAISLQPVKNPAGETIGYVVHGVPLDRYNEMSEHYLSQDKLIAEASKQSGQAILTVDVETGRVEFSNEPGLRKLGVTSLQELENGVKISRMTPELTDKSWSQKLAALTPKDEALDSSVFVFEAASATTEADLITSVFESDDGKKKAVIRVFENHQKAQLLEDLRGRSQELAVSNRELEQFSSVIAHDLRAPLRHILQFTHIIEENSSDHGDSELAENIAIISRSASTMSKMVDGLLNYSRLGRGDTELKPVDLSAIVEQALEHVQSDIEDNGVSVNVTDLPVVDAAPELMLQMVQNLIGNSIKYRSPDRNLQIEISATAVNGKWEIAFADNGIGISSVQNENIFALFKRLHSERDFPGLGIGLAACRRIAEIHNGTIDLDSSYRNGARFVVTLPVGADAEIGTPEGKHVSH